MRTRRVWLIELPSGDLAVLRCTEKAADQGETEGRWTVRGSAIPMTLTEAVLTCPARSHQ